MEEVHAKVHAEAQAVGGEAALRDEEGRLNWAKKSPQVRCVFLKEAQEKCRGCWSVLRLEKSPTGCSVVAAQREEELTGWTEENRGTCQRRRFVKFSV